MSNGKVSEVPENPVRGDGPETEPVPVAQTTSHLESVASNTVEKVDITADINHVAALGIPDSDALQKKIVRRLDMTMLPQLWILYMFNYLNRVNIAQARLNTFDEDLGLKDGDYQVSWRLGQSYQRHYQLTP